MLGGCLCGAVRYRLDAQPYDTGWCHCRTCQQSTGAPSVVFTTVPHDALVIVAGADRLVTFVTSTFGRRQRCVDCGTLLTIQVDFQPNEIDIAALTLDDPEQVQPGFHIFWANRVSWFPDQDDLPRHDAFRPDTRGLPAGSTRLPA